jgi:hypothetical protein
MSHIDGGYAARALAKTRLPQPIRELFGRTPHYAATMIQAPAAA